MAGRGRGRGRGGRGGGFVPRHDIKLRDDEQVSDVPATYPPASMPPKVTNDEFDVMMERLIIRFSSLRSFCRSSAYYIPSKEKDVCVAKSRPDVQRHMEPGDEVTTKRQALHSVVLMHAKYLPSELYSAKEQQASLRRRPTAAFKQEANRSNSKDLDEQLESAAKRAKTNDGGDDADGSDKDEEAAEEEVEDDDDDVDHEDDDYYQGEYFDDDEEYGADDDVGEGEAFF